MHSATSLAEDEASSAILTASDFHKSPVATDSSLLSDEAFHTLAGQNREKGNEDEMGPAHYAIGRISFVKVVTYFSVVSVLYSIVP